MGAKLTPKMVVEEDGQIRKQSKRGCQKEETRENKKRKIEEKEDQGVREEINLHIEDSRCPPKEEMRNVELNVEGQVPEGQQGAIGPDQEESKPVDSGQGSGEEIGREREETQEQERPPPQEDLSIPEEREGSGVLGPKKRPSKCKSYGEREIEQS